MESKKLIAAIVLGYVLLGLLGYLIHGVLLLPTYRAHEGIWRDEETMMHKRWVMWVGELMFTAVFAWIYTRNVENKPWAGQGIRYGMLMTLLTVIPTVCSQYVVYPLTYPLALKWMVAGGVELILLGLVVAYFCRKPAG